MELFTLECPKCNASLEIEDGLDTFYCKYCGTKLLVDGISGDSLNARLRVKELEHEERLQEADYDYKRFKLVHRSNEEHSRMKHALIVLGLMMFFLLVLIGGLYISHRLTVSGLERLESEIQADITAGDYDSALLKTNDMVLGDSYSHDEKRAWDKKREMYVDLIKQKRREADASNPENIYAPKSSRDFGKLTGEEAKELLEKAGFTNIELIMVEGNAGWFKPANLVEHISFGGKSDFTTEDYCKRDAKITVYYYSS